MASSPFAHLIMSVVSPTSTRNHISDSSRCACKATLAAHHANGKRRAEMRSPSDPESTAKAISHVDLPDPESPDMDIMRVFIMSPHARHRDFVRDHTLLYLLTLGRGLKELARVVWHDVIIYGDGRHGSITRLLNEAIAQNESLGIASLGFILQKMKCIAAKEPFDLERFRVLFSEYEDELHVRTEILRAYCLLLGEDEVLE